MGVPYAEVIGDPVEHSKSPAIHKFWLEQLGIEGDYRATRVTADELPDYLAARRADQNWRGCNVTMPHKRTVVPLLDEVRDFNVGAVNCIIPQKGGLFGFNTDGHGVDEVINAWGFKGWSPETRICLIGAGGGASAAIGSLNIFTYDRFDLIVRDATKGRALLESWKVLGKVYPFEDAEAAMAGRLAIINASPLGMIGFPPMPKTILEGLAGVGREGLRFAFDMVTSPVRTAFVAQAEEAGLVVSDGLTMLIGQARAAFRAFFGTDSRGSDRQLRQRLTS